MPKTGLLNMSICVAIIGAGRMGSVVAKQLPASSQKIIIDTDFDKAQRLAAHVEGIASGDLETAAAADLAAVVLPTPAVNETVGNLLNVLKKGATVLNMATTAHIDPSLLEVRKDIFIVDAKIIGHAMSISRGEPGIVVVKCTDESCFRLIKSQLSGFHRVVQGDANLVEIINKTGSTEGLKGAMAVRKKLSALNISDEWIDVAIRTVCAGTMKSFTENDLGHFALELVKKLEKEQG